MSDYIIKTLDETDIDEFCRVRLNALEQYPVAYSMMPKLFKEAPIESKLSQLTDSGSDSSNFINGIFIDKKLIGIIGFLVNIRKSVSHKGTMWGFYIDPKYQSKGLGRRLLNSYIKKINENVNIKQHRLMTPATGGNAIKLFESVGFQKYGREPLGISDGENFHDQVYYYMLS